MMESSYDALRRRVLDVLIAEAPFRGFDASSLEHAARVAAGHVGAAVHAFPGGTIEAVDLYFAIRDQEMEAALAARGGALRMRDRITLAVRHRLEAMTGDKEAVRRAHAFLLLPQNLGAMARIGWRSVDLMWHAAGDASTDLSYYTKRLTLSKVYAATFLYWLDDDSSGHEDSWAFLDRRIDAVMRFGKFKYELTQKLKGWSGPKPTRRRA